MTTTSSSEVRVDHVLVFRLGGGITWTDWSKSVKYALCAKALEEYITTDIPVPDVADLPQVPTAEDRDRRAQQLAEKLRIRTARGQTFQILYASCDVLNSALIDKDDGNPFDSWKTLKAYHVKHDNETLLRLEKALGRCYK